MAGSAEGFYSSAEFDLNQLTRTVLNQSVELGRACIAQSHRNRQVLFLLWKALALYVVSERKRFLFGCCSLTSQDAWEGNSCWSSSRRAATCTQRISCRCSLPMNARADDSDELGLGQVKVPRLFSTYLGIGAKVCSPPAIDRRFKTIDFFVIFDIEEMDSRARKLFIGV